MEDSTEYIEFNRKFIRVTVTSSGSTITTWINDISSDYPSTMNPIIVGLDVEWNSSIVRKKKKKKATVEEKPVATLQLCVGYKCLLVQLLHVDYIPASLKRLLYNMRYLFVGIDMDDTVAKLNEEYKLVCRRHCDVADVALEKWPEKRRLSRLSPSLNELAQVVAGIQLGKPKKRVPLGDWESEKLTDEQIDYACINAYAICKIVKKLDNELEDGI